MLTGMIDRPAPPANILTVMLFPPNADSHGGSQRAWYLVSSLARIAPVHFVLIFPPSYEHASSVDLEPVRAMAASVTLIPIEDWTPVSRRYGLLPKRIGQWIDVWRMGCIYAPRFGRQTLREIASRLPTRSADVLFAGRLPAAVILEDLLRLGLLEATTKVVDFDDVQSSFLDREQTAVKQRWLAGERWLRDRVIVRRVRTEEARIASTWDAVSVCSDEDVEALSGALPGRTFVRIPNVVDRPQLGRPIGSPFTLLFVGNLGFGPNSHGLGVFLDEAWPLIRAAFPSMRMIVVGLNIGPVLKAKLDSLRIASHSNVPSVEPFYAAADAVVAPIFFGGGTRVKIVEAMAYGRPVVSTSLGVEGLEVVPGRHALIEDGMPAFAAATVSLASSPMLRASLTRQARELQQAKFGKPAMEAAVRTMLNRR